MRTSLSRLAALAAIAGAPWIGAGCGPAECNGAEVLCGRRFDEVAYPTTHNAMSNQEENWALPNQHHTITRQLRAGVRGLMLDLHYFEGRVQLCHGVCQVGSKELGLGLHEIHAFLDDNPGEVVTIILESYVAAGDVAREMSAAGLLPHVHRQAVDAPWPTLREMIDSGGRLVVLSDREGGTFPWFLDVWKVAFDNDWSAKTPADFDCAVKRGSGGNSLFILNHFLTNPVASPMLAEQVNHDPVLIDHALRCRDERAHLPNFVTVDFYDIGSLFDVVRALNRL